jgi:hypothetical protein
LRTSGGDVQKPYAPKFRQGKTKIDLFRDFLRKSPTSKLCILFQLKFPHCTYIYPTPSTLLQLLRFVSIGVSHVTLSSSRLRRLRLAFLGLLLLPPTISSSVFSSSSFLLLPPAALSSHVSALPFYRHDPATLSFVLLL